MSGSDINTGILEMPDGKVIIGYENLYKLENEKSLSYYLKQIPDCRRAQGRKFQLHVCLLFIVWGLIEGFTTIREMVRAAKSLEKEQENFFEVYLGSRHGIPSHCTLSRILRNLDPEALLNAFLSWVNANIAEKGFHIAIDGKAVRASTEKVNGKKHPPYILNVYDVTNKQFIAQLEIDSKKNEISMIPVILRKLQASFPQLLEGATITTDGIGTQKKILECADEVNASVVSPVKDNQKGIKEQINDILSKKIEEYKKDPENSELSFYVQRDTGKHGRNETRVIIVYNLKESELFIEDGSFALISSVARVIRYREEIRHGGGRRYSVKQIPYQSTAPMDGKEMLGFARSHWGCEVSHYHLDTKLNEDRSTARKNNHLANFALLRKMAVNIMEEYKKTSASESLAGTWSQLHFQSGRIMELLITGSIREKG